MNPISEMIKPHTKVSKATTAGLLVANSADNNAMITVGPTVIAWQLPKTM